MLSGIAYPLLIVALLAVMARRFYPALKVKLQKIFKRRKVRFSSVSLLALLTATCLVLGYVTSKTVYVRNEVEELEALGVNFSSMRNWFGVPFAADIPCRGSPECGELLKRVHALGVRDIGAID
jgi:Trk-type K+ transport system membrane component